MLGLVIAAGMVMLIFIISLSYLTITIKADLFISPADTLLTVNVTLPLKQIQKSCPLPLPDINTLPACLSHALKRPKPERHDENRRLNISAAAYYSLVVLAMKYTVAEKLKWESSISLPDAMSTAIGSGGLWALKGIIAGLLSSKTRLGDIDLQVKPGFNCDEVSSRLDCILKMRIAHIILIASYLLIVIVRGYINGFTAGKAGSSH